MTQEISSLMDSELEAHEAERAIRACSLSEEQKQTWHLYHVIGESIRGHAPRSLALSTKVVEALQAQPTVLAPRRRIEATTFTRVALAAAASVATIGVVAWMGQGGQGGAPSPVVAKSASAIQPVSIKSTLAPRDSAQPLDVQDYLAAHRQMPSPELYRPVNNRAPAAAAR
jgi:sigma-E factor negative regulatory protein RseA